ncbi:MAG: FAD-dependent oxidoreductase [Bacteroidota bacterium]
MKRRNFLKTSIAAGIGASLLPACTQKLDTEILILGAGMAGLNLAYQLQKVGREFMILEGSDRLGGRLFTHPELNRDVGGRGIGDKYVEVMKLVEELDIEVIDITDNVGSPSAIYVDGKLYGKWEEESPNPSFLEFSKLRGALQLEQLNGWYQRPDLEEKYSDFLKKLGHTEEELKLINISSNYNDIYETSALNSYHGRAFRKFNGTKRLFNFKGGSKAFVNKVTSAINAPKLTNKMVTSITDEGQRVIVKCADGSEYRAQKVVSTLPFSTLREVKVDAPLNANQQKAIQELPYTLITQIHFTATQPFWEEDGLPIGMWTDTPLERIMNMSGDGSKDQLASWVNGKGTAFFDDMSDQEIGEYTLQKLKEIRPSTEGRIEYVGTHNWGKYPYNKGAYAEFGVGHATLFEDMIRPAGNLHFAGEHAARNSRGIEGAAESAVRVLGELLAG